MPTSGSHDWCYVMKVESAIVDVAEYLASFGHSIFDISVQCPVDCVSPRLYRTIYKLNLRTSSGCLKLQPLEDQAKERFLSMCCQAYHEDLVSIRLLQLYSCLLIGGSNPGGVSWTLLGHEVHECLFAIMHESLNV